MVFCLRENTGEIDVNITHEMALAELEWPAQFWFVG